MTRNFVLASATAVGLILAAVPADAGYVRIGSTQYANAPATTLNARDCRAVQDGQVRLVSTAVYAKYIAAHPDYKAAPSRGAKGALVEPSAARRGFAAECGR